MSSTSISNISFKNKKISFSNWNEININKDLLSYIYKYSFLYLFLNLKQIYNLVRKRKLKNKNIYFHPQKPKPFYSIYNIAKYSWLKFQTDIRKSNLIFIFDDNTKNDNFLYELNWDNIKIINWKCDDISKEKVSKIFEKTFWYWIIINPLKYRWYCVKKSNNNWAHDWKVIKCPIDKKEIDKNYVYQKLIDNSIDKKFVYDIRCPIIWKNIPFVYIKKRNIKERFSNNNTEVLVEETRKFLTKKEVKKIVKFKSEMWLDFWEIDVLRDNYDKKLYIVDVNKTSLWPPSWLKYINKIKVLKTLSESFKKEFLNK